MRNETDLSEGSDEEIAGPHFFISELADTNDRLYKFAIQVRNPRTRLKSDKVRKYHKGIREADVSLIDAFRIFDEKHVREIFLDRERGVSTSVESEPSEINTSEPLLNPVRELPPEDEVLISRLAQANTYRRQQFSQWKRHAEKAAMKTAKALDEELEHRDTLEDPKPRDQRAQSGVVADLARATNPTSRPSTATALLDPDRVKLDDEISTRSKTTISPKARDSKDDDFEVPAPPNVPKNAKHFTCPHCFILCPISTREKAAWRSSSHLTPLIRLKLTFTGSMSFEIFGLGFVPM